MRKLFGFRGGKTDDGEYNNKWDDLEDLEKPEDPEEPDQPVETKKPVSAVPVMIAIGLLMLSLGGISIGYVIYKRTQENKDSNDLP